MSAGACSTRTWLQSQSSSSARTIGSEVHTPWPISECLSRIVTLLSGAMRTNAFGATAAGGLAAWAKARRRPTGMQNATTRPADSVAVDFRKSRRLRAEGWITDLSGSRSMALLLRRRRGHQLGGAMHGRADTLIGAAAADVAGHGGIDGGTGRLRLLREP